MWLVVGLGNPGKTYEKNRHNIGFKALDDLCDRGGFPAFTSKFSGLWSRGQLAGEDVALLKPQTFMNLSGDSVQPAATFLKVAPARIVVLHDELDVPFGEVRVKIGGGHSGHNGLRSMMDRLGSADFVRLRMGIGRPPPEFKGPVADFVLGNFGPDEQAHVSAMVDTARALIEVCVTSGPVAWTPPKVGRRGGPRQA